MSEHMRVDVKPGVVVVGGQEIPLEPTTDLTLHPGVNDVTIEHHTGGTVTVWVVFIVDPYERGSAWVDSVWSTSEAAEERKTARGWGDIEIEEVVVDSGPIV